MGRTPGVLNEPVVKTKVGIMPVAHQQHGMVQHGVISRIACWPMPDAALIVHEARACMDGYADRLMRHHLCQRVWLSQHLGDATNGSS